MRTFAVVVCLLLAASTALAASKAETAVRNADQEWARVFHAKELGPSVDACAANARVLAPNAPAAVGHDQIRALFAGFFSIPDLDVTWTPDDVQVAGDMAFSTGHYSMSFTGPNGKRIEDHGKYVTVWQKEKDGAWKVVVDCFNSDVPLPAPAE